MCECACVSWPRLVWWQTGAGRDAAGTLILGVEREKTFVSQALLKTDGEVRRGETRQSERE